MVEEGRRGKKRRQTEQERYTYMYYRQQQKRMKTLRSDHVIFNTHWCPIGKIAQAFTYANIHALINHIKREQRRGKMLKFQIVKRLKMTTKHACTVCILYVHYICTVPYMYIILSYCIHFVFQAG